MTKKRVLWMEYFDIETVLVQSMIAVIAVGPPHHSMVPLPRIVLDLFLPRDVPAPLFFAPGDVPAPLFCGHIPFPGR